MKVVIKPIKFRLTTRFLRMTSLWKKSVGTFQMVLERIGAKICCCWQRTCKPRRKKRGKCPKSVSLYFSLASLRSTTRQHDDALSKQRDLTKALNNLWSQGYPPRLSHSQHNVKLSIITFFERRESLLRRKRRYLMSKLYWQTSHRFSPA